MKYMLETLKEFFDILFETKVKKQGGSREHDADSSNRILNAFTGRRGTIEYVKDLYEKLGSNQEEINEKINNSIFPIGMYSIYGRVIKDPYSDYYFEIYEKGVLAVRWKITKEEYIKVNEIESIDFLISKYKDESPSMPELILK